MNFMFRDKTVTREFRESLARELPGLARRPAYWRMAQYLLFGTFKNDDGHLMLSREVVAAIEGKKADHHYSAARFLSDFRAEALHFEVGDYVFADDPTQARVRTVKALRLSPMVEALVQAERRSHGGDRVIMSTNTTWLRKHAAAARKQDREEAERRAGGKYIAPQTARLLGYMNALPPNRFTRALRHLPEAILAAEKLPDAENQLNLLAAIREHAQPFYIPSGNTTRIFSIGASLNGLHHDIRAVMGQDWVTADLKSAQLAIVAQVWGVPTLSDYLASGKGIWKDLTRQVGLDFTPPNKKIVKDALYSAVYGAGEERMISDLAKSLRDTPKPGAQAFREFAAHPVVGTLLKARRQQLSRIRKAGGGVDAFGYFLSLEHHEVEGHNYQFDNSRSILASISQSYELRLLMPVVEAAMSQKFQGHGFTVCQWLHDGFCFDVHDKADHQLWMERLSGLVQDAAASLDIHTCLEFSCYQP